MGLMSITELGLQREVPLRSLVPDLRSLAEQHGWLFRRQIHEPTSAASVSKYRGERLHFTWKETTETKEIDQPFMDLCDLELEQAPIRFLEIDLRGYFFGESWWWSTVERKRAQARAFGESFLSFLKDAIRISSPTHGLGDTDDQFTQEQLNTTILPPGEELIPFIQRNPRRPWLAYFGPKLVQEHGAERIWRLGLSESHDVSGGVLAVFRKHPLFDADMSPEELREFRKRAETILRTNQRQQR